MADCLACGRLCILGHSVRFSPSDVDCSHSGHLPTVPVVVMFLQIMHSSAQKEVFQQ